MNRFPGSSTVEQPAVNRLVGGSNPPRGASLCQLWELSPTHPLARGRLGLVLNISFCVFPKITQHAYHATTTGGTRSNVNHPNGSPPSARPTSEVVSITGPMPSPCWPSPLFRGWLQHTGCETIFITPGSPWENPYIETSIGKLRDELLNGEIFDTLLEAQVLVERWRRHYNTVRPHSALGYRPPAPEAVQPWPPAAATPQLPALAAQAVGVT